VNRPDSSPVTIGATFAQRATFDAASIREFAEMSRDGNPLHHDEAVAAHSEFGTLIASGPHITALMMGLDATYFSRRFDALGLEFSFRFVKAIPAGTELTLEWTITESQMKPSLNGHLVSVEGRAVDDAGTVYTTARGVNLVRRPRTELT